jgi:hypothetical protein
MIASVRSLFILSFVMLAACTPERGSEAWCENKKEQSRSEWSLDDATTFATHCLLSGLTIGSKEWCEDLARKDKGKWSAEEASSYARHCLVK